MAGEYLQDRLQRTPAGCGGIQRTGAARNVAPTCVGRW
jgi:hypothetical protein